MKPSILFSLLASVTLCAPSLVAAQSGVIVTVAGTGNSGYSGDTGAATAATLRNPARVAFDAAGNLFIADTDNSVVRMVSANGVITTVAGNGTGGFSGDGGAATSAKLYLPRGVAVDAVGNLYIADEGNKRIRKVNAAGTITTFAGGGTAPGNGVPATMVSLSTPRDVAIDSAGNVYLCDWSAGLVEMINSNGIIITVAGNSHQGYTGDTGAATSARIDCRGIATDQAGNFYFADYDNNVVRKVNASGIIYTIAGTGSSGFTGDGGLATAAELYNPFGVFVAAGNVYIADTSNSRIRVISQASGQINTLAGGGSPPAGSVGDGGPATSASLLHPYGVTVTVTGVVYIADTEGNRIRKITSTAASTPTDGPVPLWAYGLLATAVLAIARRRLREKVLPAPDQ